MDVNEDSSDEEEGLTPMEAKQVIIKYLQPKETVLKALRRLGNKGKHIDSVVCDKGQREMSRVLPNELLLPQYRTNLMYWSSFMVCGLDSSSKKGCSNAVALSLSVQPASLTGPGCVVCCGRADKKTVKKKNVRTKTKQRWKDHAPTGTTTLKNIFGEHACLLVAMCCAYVCVRAHSALRRE
jgi:hypothetical protein